MILHVIDIWEATWFSSPLGKLFEMSGKLDTTNHRHYLARIAKREGMNVSFFKSGKFGAPRAKEVQKSFHPPKLEPNEKTKCTNYYLQEEKKKGIFWFSF